MENFQKNEFHVSILSHKNDARNLEWVDVFPILSVCHKQFVASTYFTSCPNQMNSVISGKMRYMRINKNAGFKLIGNLKHHRNASHTYEMQFVVEEGDLDESEINYDFKVEGAQTLSGKMKLSSDKSTEDNEAGNVENPMDGSSDGGWPSL